MLPLVFTSLILVILCMISVAFLVCEAFTAVEYAKCNCRCYQDYGKFLNTVRQVFLLGCAVACLSLTLWMLGALVSAAYKMSTG